MEHAASISHLEYVDVDVRHSERVSADEHAKQSTERRVEPRDVDQQPVLRVQAQRDHQNGPNDVSQRVSFEMSCKIREAETVTAMRINSHLSGGDAVKVGT